MIAHVVQHIACIRSGNQQHEAVLRSLSGLLHKQPGHWLSIQGTCSHCTSAFTRNHHTDQEGEAGLLIYIRKCKNGTGEKVIKCSPGPHPEGSTACGSARIQGASAPQTKWHILHPAKENHPLESPLVIMQARQHAAWAQICIVSLALGLH